MILLWFFFSLRCLVSLRRNSISRIISFPRVVKVKHTIRFSWRWALFGFNSREKFKFYLIFPSRYYHIYAPHYFAKNSHLISKPFPLLCLIEFPVSLFLRLPLSTSVVLRIRKSLFRFYLFFGVGFLTFSNICRSFKW